MVGFIIDNDDTSLFLTVLFLPVLSPSYRMVGFIIDNDDTSLFLTVLFLPVLSPSYRMVGFIISMQSLMALLLMGGAGVTTAVLRRYADIDLAVLASDLFNKVFNRQ